MDDKTKLGGGNKKTVRFANPARDSWQPTGERAITWPGRGATGPAPPPPVPLVLVPGRRPVHFGQFLEVRAMDARHGGRYPFAGRPPPVEQLVFGRRHLQKDARVVDGPVAAGQVEAPGTLSGAAAAAAATDTATDGHVQRRRIAAGGRRSFFARVLVPFGAPEFYLVERHRPHLFGHLQAVLRLHLRARRRPRPFERRPQTVHDRRDVGHPYARRPRPRKTRPRIYIYIRTHTLVTQRRRR